jgi:hypothetical protein
MMFGTDTTELWKGEPLDLNAYAPKYGPVHICCAPEHCRHVPEGEVWIYPNDPLRAWLHPADYSRMFGAKQ